MSSQITRYTRPPKQNVDDAIYRNRKWVTLAGRQNDEKTESKRNKRQA